VSLQSKLKAIVTKTFSNCDPRQRMELLREKMHAANLPNALTMTILLIMTDGNIEEFQRASVLLARHITAAFDMSDPSKEQMEMIRRCMPATPAYVDRSSHLKQLIRNVFVITKKRCLMTAVKGAATQHAIQEARSHLSSCESTSSEPTSGVDKHLVLDAIWTLKNGCTPIMIFKSADECNRGSLPCTKLTEQLAAGNRNMPGTVTTKELLADLPCDDNGEVTREEFVQWCGRRLQARWTNLCQRFQAKAAQHVVTALVGTARNVRRAAQVHDMVAPPRMLHHYAKPSSCRNVGLAQANQMYPRKEQPIKLEASVALMEVGRCRAEQGTPLNISAPDKVP